MISSANADPITALTRLPQSLPQVRRKYIASGDWLFFAGVKSFQAVQSLDSMALPPRQKGFKAKKCLFPFPHAAPRWWHAHSRRGKMPVPASTGSASTITL